MGFIDTRYTSFIKFWFASNRYFKKVVDVHKIESTAGALSFDGIGQGYFWEALVTFLYVDILDTTGTLYSMARFAGFIDNNGDFEGQYFAFMSDATSIVIGSLLGMILLYLFCYLIVLLFKLRCLHYIGNSTACEKTLGDKKNILS